MPKTKKAMRDKRAKVLKKRLKEQTRNYAKIDRRIAKIKKDLHELELDEFKDIGILPELTWEYVDRVSLFGCTAIGFRSKENVSSSKTVAKIQKWIWKHKDENREYSHVSLSRKTVDGYKILMALQMDYAEDDDYGEYEDKMVVTVFAIDNEETGTGFDAEKVALTDFAEKWGIEAEIK